MTDAPDPLVGQLMTYLKAAPADEPFVASCLDEARDLVTRHVRAAVSAIPETVIALAHREVAVDLYHRRQTRNGIATFDGPDLTPVRVTRDPMRAAADILAPWLPPLIG